MATAHTSVADITPWQLGQPREQLHWPSWVEKMSFSSSNRRFPRPCLVAAIIFPHTKWLPKITDYRDTAALRKNFPPNPDFKICHHRGIPNDKWRYSLGAWNWLPHFTDHTSWTSIGWRRTINFTVQICTCTVMYCNFAKLRCSFIFGIFGGQWFYRNIHQKCEKHIERSRQYPRTPKFKLHWTLRDRSAPKF